MNKENEAEMRLVLSTYIVDENFRIKLLQHKHFL